MIQPRKTVLIKETVRLDRFGSTCVPVCRVALAVIFRNPLARNVSRDLSELVAIGAVLGREFANQAVAELSMPTTSYGKAAIVGSKGEIEHGAAIIHPKLGAPMRAAIGGGEAIIPSNVKMGSLGTSVDVPLGNKDNIWSLDHLDTMSLCISDAPFPDEIVLILAFSDGGRPNSRCGCG